eukprot:3690265-Pyramimonas_sp.AAC.1
MSPATRWISSPEVLSSCSRLGPGGWSSLELLLLLLNYSCSLAYDVVPSRRIRQKKKQMRKCSHLTLPPRPSSELRERMQRCFAVLSEQKKQQPPQQPVWSLAHWQGNCNSSKIVGQGLKQLPSHIEHIIAGLSIGESNFIYNRYTCDI